MPVTQVIDSPEAYDGASGDGKTSSVEIVAGSNQNDTDLQRRKGGIGFVSSISKNEPVVSRRELWSYYRGSVLYYCLNADG